MKADTLVNNVPAISTTSGTQTRCGLLDYQSPIPRLNCITLCSRVAAITSEYMHIVSSVLCASGTNQQASGCKY